MAGLLPFALIRYRHRPADPKATQEPAQIYGSNQIELSWTVIPILIVMMLFLATARVLYSTEHAAKPPEALDVTVVGHRFWWEYRYTASGVVVANELHVPVSDLKQPQPTYLTMTSADTDHSFWVPRLAGKKDLIPNKVNVMWMDETLEPSGPGLWLEVLHGWVTTVDHKRIGLMYIGYALLFLVIAGFEALLMRVQLAVPNNTFVSPQAFSRLFTMHGTTMVFFVGMPILFGFGNYLIPLMIEPGQAEVGDHRAKIL